MSPFPSQTSWKPIVCKLDKQISIKWGGKGGLGCGETGLCTRVTLSKPRKSEDHPWAPGMIHFALSACYLFWGRGWLVIVRVCFRGCVLLLTAFMTSSAPYIYMGSVISRMSLVYFSPVQDPNAHSPIVILLSRWAAFVKFVLNWLYTFS